AASSELRVWGDAGHVLLEPRPRAYTLRALDGITPGRWHALPAAGPENVRTIYIERFVEAVRGGREADGTADEALAVQALMDRRSEAARCGEAVSPADLLAGISL